MIVATRLTKFYGELAAIRDLSFEIRKGEVVGFLGLNGAGKTTALRVLSCLLVPTSGTATVDGIDILERPHEIRKRIGYLPEVPPLYNEMSVRSYLDFAARLRGVARGQAAQRVGDVIRTTRVDEVAHQVIGTLSQGYRQRVGIAQAIVHRPSLLILDEPFAGLDPVQTVEMREMIRKLGGDHTVLLSSHLLSQIHEVCDRILVIQDGRIVAQGTESELASRFAGGAAIEVEVRGAAEDVASAISSLDAVESHEVEDLGEGLLRVTVRARDDVREKLAAALVNAGLGLVELRRAAPELETVFLQLARGGDKGKAS